MAYRVSGVRLPSLAVLINSQVSALFFYTNAYFLKFKFKI